MAVLETPSPSLDVRGGPLEIALPPGPPARVATRLLAALRADGNAPIGVWDFKLAASAPQEGRLWLSSTHLDQGFLILDHPGSAPLAVARHLALPPDVRALTLDLQRSSTYGDTFSSYPLRWPNEAQRIQTLDTWRWEAVPPIDWFYVELTSHCNLSCPFCPSKDLRRPRGHMLLESARVIFANIGEYLRRRDAFWGYARLERTVFLHIMGEPLLHPHFVECVRAAHDAGLVPALFTNATLLNEKNIEKIFEAKLRHITVSLNVTDEAGYGSLGAKGTFAEQEDRVAALMRERARRANYDLHVDLQYMVGAGRMVAGAGLIDSREAAWQKYREWLLRLRHQEGALKRPVDRRPSVIVDQLADPLKNDSGDPSFRLSLEAGVDLVLKRGCSFGNAVIPSGMELVPAEHGRCFFDNPSHQMAIFMDGSVSFCNLDHENSVDLGNVLEQSIDDIWGSARMQAIRHSMAEGRVTEKLCQRCLGSVVPKLNMPAASASERV